MKNIPEVVAVLLGMSCLMLVSGCSSVKSVATAVPGASLVGLKDDKPTGPQVGEKLHFKISPDEALTILAEVAPVHGWQIDATGDQYDLQGFRGKYFRLFTNRFIGGGVEMNGVFFTEPEGTYVIVGKKDTGLPQELVEPFTEAVKAKTE